MKVRLADGAQLWFDVDGLALVPDGERMRERPTILLLHGGPGMDHTSYKPEFVRLTDVGQVIYYDHRGQGRSDERTSAEWNLDVWADDVVRLCDALGIEHPIVIGNSFGGMVAMHYAARHPQHPARLVLSSTMARQDLAATVAMFEHLGGADVGAIAQAFWTDPSVSNAARYLERCGPYYTQQPGNVFETARTVRRHAVSAHFFTNEMRVMDLRAGLQNVVCPTLVLAGSLDPVCPPSSASEIAAHLPASVTRLEMFEGCGHGVFRDDPERAFALLLEFVGGQ